MEEVLERTIMINGLDEEVYDVVDECIIDNLFLFPHNDAKKISLFLTMFLSSNSKNMVFNIDDFRMKSISIRKVSTLDGEDVYDFRFYNKNRNCRLYYERFISKQAIINLQKTAVRFIR